MKNKAWIIAILLTLVICMLGCSTSLNSHLNIQDKRLYDGITDNDINK